MHTDNDSLSQLSPGDVKQGDVLLSRGWGKLSTAICLLDSGRYSHSGICSAIDDSNRPLVIEATKQGVIENLLTDDMACQKFIDVYRFIPDNEEPVVPADWPLTPVTDRANFYKDGGTRYAYNQLLLMGLLILTRKVPLGILGRARLRHWLAKFIKYFKNNSSARGEDLTCSELVYRCFYEAVASPDGKYGLTITGTIGPDGRVIRAFASNAGPVKMELDPKTAALFQEATDVLRQIRPDLGQFLRQSKDAGNDIRIMAANPNVCADMVTPHDLQKSPNLELIGRLPRKPVRSLFNYLRNCVLRSCDTI